MFNKPIEWGWHGENPAEKVEASREKKRDRFLQPEELPVFFNALAKEPNATFRDYFALLLMTGARRQCAGDALVGDQLAAELLADS